MKGMIFAGCSFTWGQGLWYYSDLPNIPKNEDWLSGKCIMPTSGYRFKDTLRFPRLVANHFNTFEVLKYGNGGSDDESFSFLNQLFNLQRKESHITTESYNYDEIDYIIYQFTEVYRSGYKFNYKDKDYSFCFRPSTREEDYILYEWIPDNATFRSSTTYNINILFEYLNKNNINFNDLSDLLIDNVLTRAKKQLQFFEEMGIKTKILTWPSNYLEKFDDWFNTRLVSFEHKNNRFKSIEELQKFDKELVLEDDPNYKINPGNDLHPSKKCHEIIANSIIKSIEVDLK